MTPYRIVFAGTPAFAAAHLSALLDSPHEIIAVYTQPDRKAGRGNKLQASPVKALALEHDIPVLQPASLRSQQAQEELRQLRPDLLIVVAYGLILPKEILETPRLGCINVHASLLPRWRGAAPIERSLLAGDEVTGVTIMLMDEGLDTGDMLHQAEVAIEQTDSRSDLESKLEECGRQALLFSLEHLERLLADATRQDDSQSSYAAKLSKSEAVIDWTQPARQIDRQVRAGIGRTPAFTCLAGERIRILHATPGRLKGDAKPGTIVDSSRDRFEVACGEGALSVDRVQLPGRSPASVRDVTNARPELFAAGIVLGRAASGD